MRNTKLFLFAIAMALVPVLLPAQITLNQSDVGAIGSQYIMGWDTLLGSTVDQGFAGANQSWDFTNLGVVDYIDTVQFLDPASTPWASDFPGSDLVIFQTFSGFYNFVNSTPTVLESEGIVAEFLPGTTFVVPLQISRQIVQFPFTFGNSFQDTSLADFKTDNINIPLVDSIRVKLLSYTTNTADAWGSLTLPNGTHNVLRVKTVERAIDSTWGYTFGNWTLLDNNDGTDSTFTWWDKNSGYLLAEFSYDDTGVADGLGYQDPIIVSAPSPKPQANQMEIFPQPAHDLLTFRSLNLNAAQVELFSLEGRKLATLDLENQMGYWNTRLVPPGIYLFRSLDRNGNLLHKGKFSVQH